MRHLCCHSASKKKQISTSKTRGIPTPSFNVEKLFSLPYHLIMDLDESLRRRLYISFITIGIFFPLVTFFFLQFFIMKSFAKANIRVDASRVITPLSYSWNALAQGGEEIGVQMLRPVIPQIQDLHPRYIRLDHIYDFYNVVSKDSSGSLSFNWTSLDRTVCDIYETGAKPFFSLGYMPESISSDGTVRGEPAKWEDWSTIVKSTIERYSSSRHTVCNVPNSAQSDVYYEVWNEPDHETFGKWSISGGKDYRTLYKYSSIGARDAQDTLPFSLGGPGTTAAYQNWIKDFLTYVDENNLRIDFLSWHRYSSNANEFSYDVKNIDGWLLDDRLNRFSNLPKIVSEWGYSGDLNPTIRNSVGAAHAVASIRSMMDKKIALAFIFEIKDGASTSHGILTNSGEKRPRYDALQMLNSLSGYRVQVTGEGDFVRAVASRTNGEYTLMLVNYDKENKNKELVPVTFNHLVNGSYTVTITSLGGTTVVNSEALVTNGVMKRTVFMAPNQVTLVKLQRER